MAVGRLCSAVTDTLNVITVLYVGVPGQWRAYVCNRIRNQLGDWLNMRWSFLAGIAMLIALNLAAQTALAQSDVKNGGRAYRVCAACHSLQPGVHLSGPSLADLWGKKAASIIGFDRNTTALKTANIVWDENTLNAWLSDPQAMVPGTTMTFRGVQANKTRADIIAFLKKAMVKGGAAKVIKEGLISEDIAMGQIPPDLSSVGANQRITKIRHCGDAYVVSTADGKEFPFWENNVRLKIDTSPRRPKMGQPVLLRSGMVGDRVSIVFSSVAQIRTLISEKC
jgi:cytochrome c